MIIGQLVFIIMCSFTAGVITQALISELQEAKVLKNKRATFIAPFQICSGAENPKPSGQDIFLQRKDFYPFIPLEEYFSDHTWQKKASN